MTNADQRLRDLVPPAHTAVLTMEVQQGVVGNAAFLPALVEEVTAAGTLKTIGRLCEAARAAGARVVHCTMESRPDGAGFSVNCKIFALIQRLRRELGHAPTDVGTPGVELVPEVGADPSDIVVPRIHGMTPFMGTSLDQILRNLGVRTVIATGVSVNLGITGIALNGVDLGYQVVVPRDAVAGVPREFADAVIDNSLALLATITTADDIVRAWEAAS